VKSEDVLKKMDLEDVTGISNKNKVDNVYIGDLLSLVMSKAKEDSIWITIQTHLNIIAVAELVDISCILVVENMEVDDDTIEKAKELGIPIFRSDNSAYDAAKKLSDLGL